MWMMLLACAGDPSTLGPSTSLGSSDSGDTDVLDTGTADTGDSASGDTASHDTASGDTASGDTAVDPVGCADWPFLSSGGTWSYTTPPNADQPFDVASVTRTAGGADPLWTLSVSDYMHWDASNPDYPYEGENTESAVASFVCDADGVWLTSVAYSVEGWGSAWGSAHPWGDDVVVSFDPPVLVWLHGGGAWSNETTAHWDGVDATSGAFAFDDVEIWDFSTGADEDVDGVVATPLTQGWSAGAPSYGNPWLWIAGQVTWMDTDGIVAFGSTSSRVTRD